MRKQFFYITIMVLLAIFLVPNIFTSTKIPIAQGQPPGEPPENGAGYIGPNTPAYNPAPDTLPGTEPSCGPASTMYCVKDGCAGYRLCTCGTPPPGSATTAFCTWSGCITNCAPATSPPATSPPATSPPATSPPATSPPATSPPATSPPATSPPATSPPPTSPPPTSPPPTLPPTEPCMIFYFELPERAWVGYPITGKWSAGAWCDDCDVDCTPYPECVWKQDSIGIGFDEYKFTLSQSGIYNYTLTCYGQGGIDERTETATVEALNLPWWREIIPVLQGFLRGIWG